MYHNYTDQEQCVTIVPNHYGVCYKAKIH